MRRLAFVIIASLILFFAPINAQQSVHTCDTCHSHADVYTAHLSTWKQCADCHGDLHALHSPKDASCQDCHKGNPYTVLCHAMPSDMKIPSMEGLGASCAKCHAVVTDHQGDCKNCHTEDVNVIHKDANILGGE